MHLAAGLLTLALVRGSLAGPTVVLGQVEDKSRKAMLNSELSEKWMYREPCEGWRIKVAWISGTNPCTTHKYAPICAAGENPCGIWFSPDHGATYKETNCGNGPVQLISGNGHHYAGCRRENWSCKMGDLYITQTWACTPWWKVFIICTVISHILRPSFEYQDSLACLLPLLYILPLMPRVINWNHH